MKKINLKPFTLILLFAVTFSFLVTLDFEQSSIVSAQNSITDMDFSLSNLTGTDALDRTLPNISGYRTDRYVGLFYFTWMGQQGEKQEDVYDITKLLRSNKNELFSMKNNDIAPLSMNYFFNEPLYGYYNSQDPYIIRKHLEMFIAAGVDFLALDFTNGIFYGEVLSVMLDIYLEYQNAGWDVPKLMFFTNSLSGTIVGNLYKNVYRSEKYDSLWFRGSGQKPMIIAWPDQLSDSLNEYFNVRPPQWPEAEFEATGWPYVEKVRPQRLFTNLISVSVAQHTGDAFSFSVKGSGGSLKESWGRGYTSVNPTNGNTEAILRGDNFQEQWDHAIENDPEIIFVTSWNEWTALKLTAEWSDVPFWVDTFNTEFSRDIEMTKAATYVKGEDGSYIQEGYGDNFYMQLLANIRKYKGIPANEEDQPDPVSKTIDINGSHSQWDDIPNTYLNISTDKIARDFYGYIETEEFHYTQDAPDNFITGVKVTHDSDNIYFKIECKSNITPHKENALNWMNLLIGVSGTNKPSWETFNYVINRTPSSDSKTSLEQVKEDGIYSFKKIGEVSYNIQGNVMQIAIEKQQLGIKGDQFSICFKVTDSIENPGDIMDHYVSGDSLPLGRLSYTYGTTLYRADKAPKKASILSVTEIIILAVALIVLVSCSLILIIKFRKDKKVK